MKKYKFKLESVLSLKKHQEAQGKQFFADTVRRLDYEKNLLQNLEAKKRYMIQFKQKKTEEGINVSKLKQWWNYIDKIDDRISHQKAKVSSAFQDLEEARASLIEQIKDRKSFEKLKFKKQQRHIKSERKIIQSLLDDKTSVLFSYNNKER